MGTPAPLGGRAVLFAAARRGEGSSRIARAFAQAAAAHALRGVWLLDLDFASNGQIAHYAGAAPDLAPGPGRDASFGATPFWRLLPPQPATHTLDPCSLVTAHRVGGSRLFVSRFHRAAVPTGGRVQMGPQPGYWEAARAALDLIVVDAPALDRSRAGLAAASDMDGVVLVADAQRADPKDLCRARTAIEARGGLCLGLVLNNAPSTIGWGGARLR